MRAAVEFVWESSARRARETSAGWYVLRYLFGADERLCTWSSALEKTKGHLGTYVVTTSDSGLLHAFLLCRMVRTCLHGDIGLFSRPEELDCLEKGTDGLKKLRILHERFVRFAESAISAGAFDTERMCISVPQVYATYVEIPGGMPELVRGLRTGRREKERWHLMWSLSDGS